VKQWDNIITCSRADWWNITGDQQ